MCDDENWQLPERWPGRSRWARQDLRQQRRYQPHSSSLCGSCCQRWSTVTTAHVACYCHVLHTSHNHLILRNRFNTLLRFCSTCLVASRLTDVLADTLCQPCPQCIKFAVNNGRSGPAVTATSEIPVSHPTIGSCVLITKVTVLYNLGFRLHSALPLLQCLGRLSLLLSVGQKNEC